MKDGTNRQEDLEYYAYFQTDFDAYQ